MRAQPEQRREEHGNALLPQSPRAQPHDANLGKFHPSGDAGLVRPVGERPRGAGKQKERRDEQRTREHHQRGRVQAGLFGETIGDKNAERGLEQIVVEGPKELRHEERRKPASGQELHKWGSHDAFSSHTVVTAAHAAAMRRSHNEVIAAGSRPYAAN